MQPWHKNKFALNELKSKTNHPFLWIAVLLLLAGCVNQPMLESLPTKPIAAPRQSDESISITYALKKDEKIESIVDPWDLIEQSKTADNDLAFSLLMRSAKEFSNNGQLHNAYFARQRLSQYQTPLNQQAPLKLLDGRLAAMVGQHALAVKLFQSLNPNLLENDLDRVTTISSYIDSLIATNKTIQAIDLMMQLDDQLEAEQQRDNQRKIIRSLQSLDSLSVSLLKERTPFSALHGWISLADVLNFSFDKMRLSDLKHWRQINSDHPALATLLDQYAKLETLEYFDQIAVLLPLSSEFGRSAQAFYDGFMDAHNRSFLTHKPNIILYDIGEETALVNFYYQTAINSGADFIVGPLGKTRVENLLRAFQSKTPTLVISEISENYNADNIFSISISPEEEAAYSAERAYLDGHRNARILRSDTPWGERVTNAFIDKWESMGGIVTKSKSLPQEMDDYSRIITKFLGLSSSRIRHKLLEAQVDTPLKFSPRRDTNIDFIFLATTADQSKLVVPQLRFFQAHDLPIYATSYVYSGYPNPGQDADLDGVQFGEMAWVLDGVKTHQKNIALKKAREKRAKAIQAAQRQKPSQAVDIEVQHLENEISAQQTQSVANTTKIITPTQIAGVNPDQAKTNNLSQQEQDPPRNNYAYSQLDKLYALGVQSYQMIPRLNILKQHPGSQFKGETMVTSVGADGDVIRHPTWSVFKNGLAQPAARIRWQ